MKDLIHYTEFQLQIKDTNELNISYWKMESIITEKDQISYSMLKKSTCKSQGNTTSNIK